MLVTPPHTSHPPGPQGCCENTMCHIVCQALLENHKEKLYLEGQKGANTVKNRTGFVCQVKVAARIGSCVSYVDNVSPLLCAQPTPELSASLLRSVAWRAVGIY